MRTFLRHALDTLLPRRCLVCRRAVSASESGALCPGCWCAIVRIEGPQCPVCGNPFRSEASLSHSPTHRCGDCRDAPPAFTRAASAGLYEGVLADAIRRCKYRKQVTLIPTLGALLDPVIQTIPPVDAVLPVPLHPSRLRAREFNQSLLLAAWVSRRLGRPLLPDALRRLRWTEPQTTLTRAQRRANVRGAFAVRHPKPVTGRRLLLVDDVYTTGATANECARVLRKAGAAEVYVVTLARMM
jgi:ComF family protein